jgi:hypothetical protein
VLISRPALGRSDIKAAIRWLEKLGVTAEPVEINVIES